MAMPVTLDPVCLTFQTYLIPHSTLGRPNNFTINPMVIQPYMRGIRDIYTINMGFRKIIPINYKDVIKIP